MRDLALLPATQDRSPVRLSTTGRARHGSAEIRFAEPPTLWEGWPGRGASPRTTAPVLIRYRSDDFMERFTGTLADAGAPPWPQVDPAAALASGDAKAAAGQALRRPLAAAEARVAEPYKLFQPLHGDFHLVVGSLVRQTMGYPDLCPTPDEPVHAVVRRRRTGAGPDRDRRVEEAWIPELGWVSLGGWEAPDVHPEEERLQARRHRTAGGRTVYVAYLPTSSRETYAVTADDDPLSAAGEGLDRLRRGVEERLEGLVAEGRSYSRLFVRALRAAVEDEAELAPVRTALETGALPDPLIHPGAHALSVRLRFGTIAGVTWTTLLADADRDPYPHDLVVADPDALDAVRDEAGRILSGPNPLIAPRRLLASRLGARLDASWRAALALLEVVEGIWGGWPETPGSGESRPVEGPAREIPEHGAAREIPLEEVFESVVAVRSSLLAAHEPPEGGIWNARDALAGVEGARPDTFRADLTALDPELLPTLRRELADRATGFEVPRYPPRPSDDGAVHFVVRFVWQTTHCLVPRIVFSDASEPFVLAPPFDPDAPARDIRIPMPLELTAEALSKAKKGLGLMMSDQVRGAIDMGLRGKDAMDDPQGPPSFQMGALVSLSIPIVTICALIVLLIIASILHIVMQWLPFLITVIPIKLKARP